MILKFLAPSLTRKLCKKDVLVVQNYVGQNAGGPTTCFTGTRPIYLANLYRAGHPRTGPQSVEFIPLSRGTLRKGLKVTNIICMGSCLLGEDFSTRYQGQVVYVPGKTGRKRRPKRKSKCVKRCIRRCTAKCSCKHRVIKPLPLRRSCRPRLYL